MRSPKPIIFAGFIALLLLFSTAADAAYKRDYASAKKSFEDGDYRDAIQKLNLVIAENPESVAMLKLYGMVRVPYLPHYYLGQAYFKLNDCSSAIRAWKQFNGRWILFP